MILITATVVPFQTINACNQSNVVAEVRLLTTVMRTGFATISCRVADFSDGTTETKAHNSSIALLSAMTGSKVFGIYSDT